MAQIDFDNADRFIEQHGGLVRWDPILKSWFVWNGNIWQPESHSVGQLATDTLRGLMDYRQNESAYSRAELTRVMKRADESGTYARKRAMLLEVQDRVSMQNSAWDADPMLLGCQNGIVDLRVGELIGAYPEYFISKAVAAPFDSEARAPRWEKALREWFPDQPEMHLYLQRCVGYAITGSVKEQAFWGMVGTGANGKSTFLGVIRRLLGSYAQTIAFSSIEKAERSKEAYELATLGGKRFVIASETQEETILNEGRIKSITGETEISVRQIYEKSIYIKPEAKFFLAFNHRPHIQDTSDATWSRMHLVEFKQKFKRGDGAEDLENYIVENELPGVLNWAIQGCLAWQEMGLKKPEEVREAVQDYRESCDRMIDFFDGYLEFGNEFSCGRAELYSLYKGWYEIHNGSSRNMTGPGKFNNRMRDRGCWEARIGPRGAQVKSWCGVRIKTYDLSPRAQAQVDEGEVVH